MGCCGGKPSKSIPPPPGEKKNPIGLDTPQITETDANL